MSKLPQVKPAQLVKALKKVGFAVQKQKGGHVDLKHPDGRRTTVAIHTKPLAKGTFKAILRQTELTVEKLKELL